MTPKQKVLKVEPKAFCETCGSSGLSTMYQIVVPRYYGNVQVLAIPQRSRRAAWEQAARQLSSTRSTTKNG